MVQHHLINTIGCFKCGEEGHQARECPSAGTASTMDSSDADCPKRAPLYIPEDVDDEKLFELGIRSGRNIDSVYSMPVKVRQTKCCIC